MAMWVLGVDIGSKQDGLAMTVGRFEQIVPKKTKTNPYPRPTVAGSLSYCESVPGTDYSDMPIAVVQLALAVAEQMPPGDTLAITVDVTGSGRPVGPAISDLIHETVFPGRKPKLHQCVITGGLAVKEVSGTQQVNVSRTTLLEEFVLATRGGHIEIKLDREQAKGLKAEMKTYSRASGRADHEGVNSHDDRIMSSALAYLGAKLAFKSIATVSSAANMGARGVRRNIFADATPANPNWDPAKFAAEYAARMGATASEDPLDVASPEGIAQVDKIRARRRRNATGTYNPFANHS